MIRFLGTGTSTGVPQLGCDCEVCRSRDVRDNRLRSSLMIRSGDLKLLIDCSPDFRQQMFEIPFKRIDGILFTHEHYDHVGGIDELRPYSKFGTVELYMEERLEMAIRTRLPYCFGENKYKGVPDLHINRIEADKSFKIGHLEILPIRVMHYMLPILGFRIGDFAYLTDVKTIDEHSYEKLKGVDTLVINALRRTEHISHLTLDQAIEVSKRIGARETYFTHISHEMGMHADVEKILPDGIHLAYDGLELPIL
ncbi:MAG: MBL fold metallo-hydrolase [Fermentimonas sp.]